MKQLTRTTTVTPTNLIAIASNNMFRASQDERDSSYIFDNQINAAKEIVTALHDRTTRRNHVMLLAKMQSGKTGACNATVNIINHLDLAREMGIDKFIFITGMNDCGLKHQTYERIIEQIDDANVSNVYNGKRSLRKLNNPKYFVLKNSDLMSYEGDLNNSLIFIDECHYGSKEKNILTKFLYKHKVNWRDESFLISRNIYMVSVSATPFSEIISDKGGYKKCIELKTNDGYIGVSQYIENGNIHCGEFKDAVGEVTYALADALEDMEKNDEIGVCIVRTRKFDEMKEDLFVSHNFDIFEMYAAGSKIEYDKLAAILDEIASANAFNKKFEGVSSKFLTAQKIVRKPLLVLIKGAYRAGVTISPKHKDLIYMVYDYSKLSAATAQAMLGRMCGYRANGTELKTQFYVNDGMAEMYSNWEKDFSNRDNVPCDKTKQEWLDFDDMKNGEIYTSLASKTRGNFTIDLSDEEIEYLDEETEEKKTSKLLSKLQVEEDGSKECKGFVPSIA